MKGKKVIDLTRAVSDKVAGVRIDAARTLNEDGWNASTLQLYSHSGTHMDAPFHFEVNPQTIDKLPPDRLISRAWVVDLRPVKPGELLQVSQVESIEEVFEKGDSLILHTGWSKKHGSSEYRDKLPRISKELAVWMGEKGVNILGVEPPSVADVNNLEEVTEIHQILMKNDIIILEGLVNLEALSKAEVTLIALPLKVYKGDGAPARVIALEE
ncbi:MAG: cyclase family protein [Bacteroidota bacterium]